MKKIKTVMVKGSECTVETLREWLTHRIEMLKWRQKFGRCGDFDCGAALQRASELEIILEKINDGRIQEIGKKGKS